MLYSPVPIGCTIRRTFPSSAASATPSAAAVPSSTAAPASPASPAAPEVVVAGGHLLLDVGPAHTLHDHTGLLLGLKRKRSDVCECECVKISRIRQSGSLAILFVKKAPYLTHAYSYLSDDAVEGLGGQHGHVLRAVLDEGPAWRNLLRQDDILDLPVTPEDLA